MTFRLFLLSLLCLAPLSSAWADTLRILIDGSGSMRGYQRTGALDALVGDLFVAGREAGWDPAPRVFVTTALAPGEVSLLVWDTWSSDPTWGIETHLDKALEQGGSGAHALVLLTDNFQDEANLGGGRAGSTERFYDLLRSQPMSRAWLVPVSLEFEGAVELAARSGLDDHTNPAELRQRILESTPSWAVGKGGIGTPSHTQAGPWQVQYQGHRGLATYFLLYEPSQQQAMVALTAALAKRREIPEPLLVRPLGMDSIVLRSPTRLQPDAAAMTCLGSRAGPFPRPNLRVQATGGQGELVPDSSNAEFRYDPRQPGTFTAAIEVAATESYVRVGAPEGSCGLAASVQVGPVVPRVPEELRGILIPAQSTGTVTPPVIVGRLSERTEGSGALFVSTELPPLVGPEVPPEVFDEKLTADFDITITLPRAALGLDAAVADRYFTSDPLDLARIYSPTDVVRHLASDEVALVIPVHVGADVMTGHIVDPPRPPWLAISAALAALVAAWWYLRPLGFEARVMVRYGEDMNPHDVQLGGLFRPRPAHPVHVGDNRCVNLRRAAWYSRSIRVSEGDRVIFFLSRGQRLNVDAAGSLQWLGPFQDSTP
jgi:hypothetical protein